MRLNLPGVCAACAAVMFVPAAWAQTTPAPVASVPTLPAAADSARIYWAGAPLAFPADAAPFRDPADGAWCVPVQSLAPLGAAYIVDERMGKVTFALPGDGATVTVGLRSVPFGASGKGYYVPVMDVVTGLGGKCEWDGGANILYTRSVLTGVSVVDGQLQIKATLPIRATVTRDAARRLVLDIPGCELGPVAKSLNLQVPSLSAVRAGQFLPDVTRIVLETRDVRTGFAPVSDQAAPTLALNQTTVPVTAPPVIVAKRPSSAANTPGVKSKPAPIVKADSKSAKFFGPPATISGVTLRQISERKVQLVVNAGRGAKGMVPQAALNRQTLTLDFLNSVVGSDAAASLAGATHPFLKAARFVAGTNGVSRLVLDLTRAVAFSVRPTSDGSVMLEMSLPQGAGGRLAGKLIVVDPGHGFITADNKMDTGARGTNGTLEKNVNLAIASRLADILRDAGANVIMTRSGDAALRVNDRPRVANRAGADFFISVHSDDGDSNHSVNGSTVYFHGNDPYCRMLAQSIAQRLENMGGIRSKGTRTDFIRFPGSGFGVLRNSRMTAVLVECGYMSNAGDVRLLNDPGMQRKLAENIAAGLRDYIEGNPDVDTRNTNPNVPVPPTEGPTEGAETPSADPSLPNDPVAMPDPTTPTEPTNGPEKR